MTKFLCISGRARHGKDTSAEVFKRVLEGRGHSVLIVHYADLLKHICKSFFGWDGNKDEAGRTMLQYVGTDRVRSLNPNYWVDFIISMVSMFPDTWDYVIIPDTRFPNEISRISGAGFPVKHIRVVRDGFNSHLTDEQKNHQSETALDGIEPDFWLYNKTIDQLESDVLKICDDISSEEVGYVQLSIFDNVDDSCEGETDSESN